MVNRVTVPNFSQYNFAIGDTTEVVTKQNGVNAALQQFGNSLNTTIDQFNDDVGFVDTARQELDANNIVHTPGSGLPNEAGTAYSRDMGTGSSQIRTNQQNDGRYYTQDQVDNLLAARLPAGMITMWSGSISAIPAGWALCNGSNGTPNLRNRFIVGAGGGYPVGDTGGADSVTLTTGQIPAHNHSASTGSAGGHTHSGTANSAGGHSHSGSTNTTGSHTHTLDENPTDRSGSNSGTALYGSGYREVRTNAAGNHSHSLSINSNGAHTHSLSINSNGAHTHTVSVGSIGGGGSHENRPPYYALAYIMKL